MADEAYRLYPEWEGHLRDAAQRPDHVFFKRFGEQMPAGDWNRKGTKQGIYMIGPDAEYLEGRFAASGEPADVRARLRRALERWDALREEKGYANRPVPPKPWAPPPGVEGELVLRVNVRDLPRGAGDRSGARRHEVAESRMWLDFTKWAWNEGWVAIDRARSLVPTGRAEEPVDPAVWRQVVREAFVDTVRGQAPEWKDEEVREARVTMRRREDGRIEYRGSFRAEGGGRAFSGKVYGQGVWDDSKGAFVELDIVALGERSGKAQFNQRENDFGPAPMGVTLSLSRS